MLCYNLGATTWQDTQAIGCALAQLEREGAILARPKSACLCIGAQVNLDQEIDAEFCRARGIPIFRRETHGRALCFAQAQLEVQVVLSRDHRLLAPGGNKRFRAVLGPIWETCRDLRLALAYQPPTEIIVRGRRIASACLSEVGQYVILAASLALEFDPTMFACVLNAPDEKVRARLVELVPARRTSLQEELGTLPPIARLEQKAREYLQWIVGGLRPATLDAALRAKMRDLSATLLAPGRLQGGQTANGWNVYIGAGAELQQRAHKAPGGWLRATSEWQDGRIVHVSLAGDFFCYPPGALLRLEEALIGVRGDQVAEKIDGLYRELGLVTPGVQPAHWAKVIAPAAWTKLQPNFDQI